MISSRETKFDVNAFLCIESEIPLDLTFKAHVGLNPAFMETFLSNIYTGANCELVSFDFFAISF